MASALQVGLVCESKRRGPWIWAFPIASLLLPWARADRGSTFPLQPEQPPLLSHTLALTYDSAGKRRFSFCWNRGPEKLGEAGGLAVDGVPVAPECG